MAVSNKVASEQLRKKYIGLVKGFLKSIGEEVYEVKSNEIGFPVVDINDDEKAVVIVVKVPTGSKDDPYDVYTEAENYAHELKEKEIKAQKKAEEKKKKIEHDKKVREQKEKEKSE